MCELKIKDLREKLGVSQEKLAEMLGVHPRTIQNWEAGGNIPNSKHAILRKLLADNSINQNSFDALDLKAEVTRLNRELDSLRQTIAAKDETIAALKLAIEHIKKWKNVLKMNGYAKP